MSEADGDWFTHPLLCFMLAQLKVKVTVRKPDVVTRVHMVLQFKFEGVRIARFDIWRLNPSNLPLINYLLKMTKNIRNLDPIKFWWHFMIPDDRWHHQTRINGLFRWCLRFSSTPHMWLSIFPVRFRSMPSVQPVSLEVLVSHSWKSSLSGSIWRKGVNRS